MLQQRDETQQGFSLLELLIAMALSLLVIGGVVTLLIDAQRSQMLLQQQTRLQESARLALDIVLADLRQSGHAGCDWTSINIANVVAPDSSNYLPPFPIVSGSNNVEDYGFDVVDGTDVLTLTVLESDPSWVISNQTSDADSTDFTLTAGSRIDAKYDNRILAVVDSDCSQLSLFRATRNSSSSISTHSDNCTHQLRGHFDCSDTSAASSDSQFSPDSRLYLFTQHSYAIREQEDDDVKTILLGRINSDANSEVLVEGVTDLQLRYGLDTNDDDAVDRFVDAQHIRDSATLNFSQVVSVEIDVTVTSESPLKNGEPLSATLSSSVYLRNKGS
ncbi:PilW family protein [Saccharospirillum mangrovi]|uniref:PilW family protein n=1 Tax=Saccharospirillum mangrovi TaxID=2161747 RepID=UPI0013B37897|nr:PilW family protein [Saccharospirillum mangrovi]